LNNITCIAAAETNVGRIRKNNEDNFCFDGICLNSADDNLSVVSGCREFPGSCAFAVFDGMGGESCGEKASEIAAHTFREHFAKIHKVDSEKKLEKLLNRFYRSANNSVRKLSKKIRATSGTTAAILVMMNNRAYISNIGDSKVFRLSEGGLVQISEDHTMAGVMIRSGVMTPEEASRTKGRNSLTRFLGSSSDDGDRVPCFSIRVDVRAGDRFLLCSDGLTDMVTEERIAGILSAANTSCPEKVSALVGEAMANGGRDNCTVILVETA